MYTCPVCKKQFIANSSIQKYCSDECRAIHRKLTAKPPVKKVYNKELGTWIKETTA